MRNKTFPLQLALALLLGGPLVCAQTSATTKPTLGNEAATSSKPTVKTSAAKTPAAKPATTTLAASKPAPPELPEKVREAARIVSDSFGAPVELVETFMREAIWLQKNEKVPAAAFVGLAILESAGFSSELYQKAKNPFGMKATKPLWTGPVHKMWHEGKMTDFRKYDTPRGAVQDFAKFLRSRKWFRDAFTCPADDYNCFINKMMADAEKKEPGYARDPEWGNKIRRVIKKYKLEPLGE